MAFGRIKKQTFSKEILEQHELYTKELEAFDFELFLGSFGAFVGEDELLEALFHITHHGYQRWVWVNPGSIGSMWSATWPPRMLGLLPHEIAHRMLKRIGRVDPDRLEECIEHHARSIVTNQEHELKQLQLEFEEKYKQRKI